MILAKRLVFSSAQTNEGPERKKTKREVPFDAAAFSSLPPEIQLHILQNLAGEDLIKWVFVSKSFNTLVNGFFQKRLCLFKARVYTTSFKLLLKTGLKLLELGYLEDAKRAAEEIIEVRSRALLLDKIISKLIELGRKEEAHHLFRKTLPLIRRAKYKDLLVIIPILLSTAYKNNFLGKEKIVQIATKKIGKIKKRIEVLSRIFPANELKDIVCELYKKPLKNMEAFLYLFEHNKLDWSIVLDALPFLASNLDCYCFAKEDKVEGPIFQMLTAYNQAQIEEAEKWFNEIPAPEVEKSIKTGEQPPLDLVENAKDSTEVYKEIQQARDLLQEMDRDFRAYEKTLFSVAFLEKKHLGHISEETYLKINEHEVYLAKESQEEVSEFLLQKVDFI